MRILKWFIFVVFLLGILFLSIGFLLGADVFAVFNNDEDYGDLIIYQTDDKPNEITLDFDYREIYIHLHDAEYIEIRYYQKDDDTWTFNETVNGLTVTQEQPNTWFSFGLRRPSKEKMSVNVYLPNDVSYTLDLHTNVGRIDVEFDAYYILDQLIVASDVGSISLSYVNVLNDFSASTSTGSVDLKHVIGDDLVVRASVGSITIDQFSVNNLSLETSTGSIDASNGVVSGDFVAETSTGSIDIDLVSATDYDLTSSTGSIDIVLEDLSIMYYELETSTGSISLDGLNQGQRHQTQQTDTKTIRIKAILSTGSIKINQA
ncbi:MAG: DUF4097 family beta strand repeat-containing protein [Acholeplasmataceae bacterium]